MDECNMAKQRLPYGNDYYVSTNGNVYHGEHKLSPIKIRGGYLTVDICGKRHMIHRLVAEAFISDYTNDKQVHHKDGNNTNNDVNNLECINQLEHMRLHRLKYPLIKICQNCKEEFQPDPTKRKIAKFCSRKCYLEWMRG